MARAPPAAAPARAAPSASHSSTGLRSLAVQWRPAAPPPTPVCPPHASRPALASRPPLLPVPQALPPTTPRTLPRLPAPIAPAGLPPVLSSLRYPFWLPRLNPEASSPRQDSTFFSRGLDFAVTPLRWPTLRGIRGR